MPSTFRSAPSTLRSSLMTYRRKIDGCFETSTIIRSKPGMVKFAVAVAMVAFASLFAFSSTKYSSSSSFSSRFRAKKELRGKNIKETENDLDHDEDLHKIFHSREGESRCYEEETEYMLEDFTKSDEEQMECNCPDPLVPKPRYNEPAWMKHHELMVREINDATGFSSSSSVLETGGLDVLFIGDSITERWRGTSRYGQHVLEENMKDVFNSHFNKTAGGHVNGCAVGSAGDITSETLWHLEHGFLPAPNENNSDDEMPNHHPPKMFLLLIGTNDLGRSGCSKATTLMGILNIADLLHHAYPETPILFHGLLPRSDPNVEENEELAFLRLGAFWNKIMWINREMHNFAKMHKNWYYMDASKLFLQRNKGSGDVEIRGDLMPDGLHPNLAGYEAWAPILVKHILKILGEKLKRR